MGISQVECFFDEEGTLAIDLSYVAGQIAIGNPQDGSIRTSSITTPLRCRILLKEGMHMLVAIITKLEELSKRMVL